MSTHHAPSPPPLISANQLVDRYDIFFLDAFGVLVDAGGAVTGAQKFIEELDLKGKDYWIISNGCYGAPSDSAASYLSKGVNVREDRVITAATVMGDILARESHPPHNQTPHNREERYKVRLLGAPFVRHYLSSRAPHVRWVEDDSFDCVIIGDQQHLNFPYDIDELITDIVSQVTRKTSSSTLTHPSPQPNSGDSSQSAYSSKATTVPIYLPNPDLVYPRAPGHYGLTSGSLGLLIEHGLKVIMGETRAPKIIPLGKPHGAIFQKALAEVTKTYGTDKKRIVMIGDQLRTDIRGARIQGLDSVLMKTGVTALNPGMDLSSYQDALPSYVAPHLKLK